ncbi:hypothetical protein [Pseudomonas antarctica]|uniref:hypothetical protein n=1 Tax=Pseudomonas antarctica TaxID=219572 RepID=UPI0012E984BF|nr:hypothetical protein [Pseudomonas antarctica]
MVELGHQVLLVLFGVVLFGRAQLRPDQSAGGGKSAPGQAPESARIAELTDGHNGYQVREPEVPQHPQANALFLVRRINLDFVDVQTIVERLYPVADIPHALAIDPNAGVSVRSRKDEFVPRTQCVLSPDIRARRVSSGFFSLFTEFVVIWL